MAIRSRPARKVLSILIGLAAVAAIFTAAALLGALVANATSPATPYDGRLGFERVSSVSGCWMVSAGRDGVGAVF